MTNGSLVILNLPKAGEESPSNEILRPAKGPPEAGKRVNGQAQDDGWQTKARLLQRLALISASRHLRSLG
ncbi:hypothetical protein COT52_02620 [candidate division WWE3 bacterium CG08_land_8_20_14_0_20_43_13]|uniref:Uncharacterized protein n=1 Tax=candidate division WWE3 bacterium CG08_land_8_20_14_0_20_43_13 TaxID=1975087 RepID=A0A2H0X6X1_UNCKA|nr:MAG: hypothetical protein COT52_02620 [candidate division WWE3 bacterium CG08_land_8_20_14_0_20_43_13]